jgi:hypothetical protein
VRENIFEKELRSSFIFEFNSPRRGLLVPNRAE